MVFINNSARAKVITFANQKGGVGKTTFSKEFAYGLARRGFRVLGVDMDPQGNFSSSCDVQLGQDSRTAYNLLLDECIAEDAIQHTSRHDIIPSNIILSSAEVGLTSKIAREYRLRNALEPIINDYDYVVVDTAPSLGMLTINAITAADKVIIPVIPDIDAITATISLKGIIEEIKKECNPKLTISGIVRTRFDSRTNNSQLCEEMLEKMADAHGLHVFFTSIRSAILATESKTAKMTVGEYAKSSGKKSDVVDDYDKFINEYLEKEEIEETWL